MICVKYNKSLITIKGHADYAEVGKDIVCASVSSIINTTVNSILNINENAINYSDDGNIIKIVINRNDSITMTLLNTMIELLKDLEKKYKQNIKTESED